MDNLFTTSHIAYFFLENAVCGTSHKTGYPLIFRVASFDVTIATVWRRAPARVSATTEAREEVPVAMRSCAPCTSWPSVLSASICWQLLTADSDCLETRWFRGISIYCVTGNIGFLSAPKYVFLTMTRFFQFYF